MAAISDIMRNNQHTECPKNGFTKKKVIVSLCYELELKNKFRHVRRYFCMIPHGFRPCWQSGTALPFTGTVVEFLNSESQTSDRTTSPLLIPQLNFVNAVS